MKTKLLVFATAFALLTAPALAQDQSNSTDTPEANPGLVGSGSPVYGLELAMDNAAISVGLKMAGKVAQERAAEARKASQNNNSKGMQRAAQALEKTADRAQESDEEGISRAISMMQETIENAPNEQARQGMQTALNNMRDAQQQRQQDRETGQQQPSQSNDNQNRENQTQGQQSDRDQSSGQDRDNTTSGSQQDGSGNTSAGRP